MVILKIFTTILAIGAGSLLAVLATLDVVPLWLVCLTCLAVLVLAVLRERPLGSPFVWTLALLWLALRAVMPLSAHWVATDAERVAGNAPYCIQVADSIAGYREARTWLDLSASSMRGEIENDLYMQFHAVLTIGTEANPRLYNWSYRSMSWQDASDDGSRMTVVTCLPRRHFAAELPFIHAETTDPTAAQDLRFLGRRFVIPAAYWPRASATTAYLSLVVNVLDFTPLDVSCDQFATCINHVAEIYFYPGSVMNWLNNPPTEKTRLIDESDGPNGHIKTRVDCWPSSFNEGFNCVQYFQHDGMLFSFRLRESDLGQWREAENRFIALFHDLQPQS